MSETAPSKCPECDSPAYVGMNQVECVEERCRHFSLATFEEWDREQREKRGEVEAVLSVGWVEAILNGFPTDPFGGPPWEYILPNHVKLPWIGMFFQDMHGRGFRVAGVNVEKSAVLVDEA